MNLSKRNICISNISHLLNASAKRDLNIENSGKIPLNQTLNKSNKYTKHIRSVSNVKSWIPWLVQVGKKVNKVEHSCLHDEA